VTKHKNVKAHCNCSLKVQFAIELVHRSRKQNRKEALINTISSTWITKRGKITIREKNSTKC